MTSTLVRSSRPEELVGYRWSDLYMEIICKGIGMHKDGVMMVCGNARRSMMIARDRRDNGIVRKKREAEDWSVNIL